ncbi:MAG TPA: hypothetical protein VGD04_06525 [Methylophilus sp.]
MAHFELKAYGADRVVIAVQNGGMHKKILQINFKSRDGSIFVNLPYAKLGTGRVGIVEHPLGDPHSLLFGESAPFTSHSVKYTHHPDGEAHFSLDGKVFTRIRRKAVPLTAAEGHIFTVMVQGLNLFEDINKKDVATPKRGIASMPVREGHIEALKFVGHLYSATHFAEKLSLPQMDSPFIPLKTPDGRVIVGVVLATRLKQTNLQYLLVVSVEPIDTIAKYTDLYVSLMGGFDPPDVAFDHNRSMSFLIMMYPEVRDSEELRDSVGSIDLVVKPL